jgi:hypothetical protein
VLSSLLSLLIYLLWSSGPLVLIGTTLNDGTMSMASRIAAHLLDLNSTSKPKGASCSFREGVPALAIVVNQNDGAVRQEAQPGGLRAELPPSRLGGPHLITVDTIYSLLRNLLQTWTSPSCVLHQATLGTFPIRSES